MKDYTSLVNQVGIGRTPQLCQDALVELLKDLFKGKKFTGQESEKELNVYPQDLPEPEGSDYDVDTDKAYSPYVIARMVEGAIEDDNSTQVIEFQIVICCYNTKGKQYGYREVSNIKEGIIQQFCKAPYFGGAFTILKPIAWALQIDSTAPYYYGAVNINVTAPAMSQDQCLEGLV